MQLKWAIGWILALCYFVITAQTATSVEGQNLANQNANTNSLNDIISNEVPEVKVTESPDDIVESIPDNILRSNNRYVTFSFENDYLAFNGVDRDYTNGFRLTYFNVGQDQPRVLHWVDQLIPTYEINKTSSTYYSFGQNLYTPHDITQSEYIEDDRPYGAFLYGSAGMATITDDHKDDVELTFGMIGPAALGETVQKEFHRIFDMDIPKGWDHQLHNELGIMLSYERTYPTLYGLEIGESLSANFSPHYGVTVGNVYTYANAGFNLDLTPQSMPWQTHPVRVRPAIPGSGFFETPPKGYTWQLFAGLDTRFMLRNIFLDGNSFRDSHSVKKKPFVIDAAIGAAYTWRDVRITYTYNWRSKEYYSPYSKTSRFGAMSFTYRF